MPTRINPDQVHIPSHHRWFFEHACGADPLRYLAGRRLLEVTLHAPRAAIALPSPHEPKITGRFEDLDWPGRVSGEFVINGIHARDSVPRAKTVFRTTLYRGSLYAAVRCEDPSGIARMPLRRHALFNGSNLEMLPFLSDYVSVIIDPEHGHHSYWEFTATPSGGKLTARGKDSRVFFPVHPISMSIPAPIGPPFSATVQEQGPDVTSRWDLRVRRDRNARGWTALFRIPLDLLGGSPGATIGFNVARVKHSMPPEQTIWSPVRWFGENFRVPLRFGDLYLGDTPVTVREHWLGQDIKGDGELVIHACNPTDREQDVTWVVGSGPAKGRGRDVFRHRTCLKPGSNTVRLHPNVGLSHLRALAGRDGRLVFEARYPLATIPRLGTNDVAPPSKRARDYDQRKMAWLASRLPRLIRVNTADGAPSDFCFADTRGRVLFDLMKPDALRKMARFIERRFDDPDDRLAAAGILLRQPDVMVYELIENFADLACTPLSVIRFGSAICGAFATMIKGLVEALRPPGGGRYRAYKYGVSRMKTTRGKITRPSGHTLVLVVCPDGRQVLLNDGSVYYTRRGKRLVGPRDVEELATGFTWRHDPSLDLVLDSGSQVWPAGAPEE